MDTYMRTHTHIHTRTQTQVSSKNTRTQACERTDRQVSGKAQANNTNLLDFDLLLVLESLQSLQTSYSRQQTVRHLLLDKSQSDTLPSLAQ